MIVGIDVHKRSHAAALLDERGGEVATLGFANSPEGMQRLRAWLVAHDAGEAIVGVESPAGYGRLLVESLLDPNPSEYVRSLTPDRFTERRWDWEEARRQAQSIYETYYGVGC